MVENRAPEGGTAVLLVEDDAVAGGSLASILKASGYEVTWARTNAQAKAALRPELRFILLDLLLPDGNGREVADAARAAGLKARIVVITGADDRAIEEIVALKPQLVLHKPVQPHAMLAWLRDLGGSVP